MEMVTFRGCIGRRPRLATADRPAIGRLTARETRSGKISFDLRALGTDRDAENAGAVAHFLRADPRFAWIENDGFRGSPYRCRERLGAPRRSMMRSSLPNGS